MFAANQLRQISSFLFGVAVAADLIDAAESIDGVTVVVAEIANGNANLLRQLIDQIRKTASPCVVLLAAVAGESKVVLVAGVSRDLIEKVKAGALVKDVAPVVGGKAPTDLQTCA